MDREEQERMEQEERLARKKELREAQMKRKKQEEQIMIGGGIILLAVIALVIVLAVRSCNQKKDPDSKENPKKTETTLESDSQSESADPSSEQESDAQESQSEAAASEDSTEGAENTEAETPGVVIPPADPNAETTAATEAPTEATEAATGANEPYPETNWDLTTLDATPVYFGYAPENRDPETHIPTDWAWYESQWGQFNVDWIQDTSQNIIYLTMDEGYPNEYTNTILDILSEKNVKACFFLTQMFLDGGEQSEQQIRRMIEDGHVLGNHTVTHRSMPSLSIEEQTAEITTINNNVRDRFGYELRLFRFPEGIYSSQCLGLVDNLGMKTCFWSYAYNDYSEEQPPVEESLQKAIDGLHPGAVYLLHANSSTNTAFLAQWIDEARARGFEFGIYPQTAN